MFEDCIACNGEGKFCGDCGGVPSECECTQKIPSYVTCDMCDGVGHFRLVDDEEDEKENT